MKQSKKKEYSVKHIYERCLITNAAYLICCSVFSIFVLRNNLTGSQDSTPLLFFVLGVIALALSVYELFLRDGNNVKFIPKIKYLLFFGKILVLCLFEAVMIIFTNYPSLIAAIAVLSPLYLVGIYLIFRKYLRSADPIKLHIEYKIDLKETRGTYVFFVALYSALFIACVIWAVLEIVLGLKFIGSIEIGRTTFSLIISVIMFISLIVNVLGLKKFNRSERQRDNPK